MVGIAHNATPLTVLLDRGNQEKFIKRINLKCQALDKAKTEIKKRCDEIIEFTLKKYKNTIKKLNDQLHYYHKKKKLILEGSELDKHDYETRLYLSESIIEYYHNSETIQQEINSYLNYDILPFPDDESLFWLQGTNLFKLDIKTWLKSSFTVPFSFQTYNNSCRVTEKNSFFKTTTRLAAI